MRKNGFFAMMTRMRNITRWGLMRNNITENLTEHSYDTAVTAHALAVIGKEKFGKDIDPGQIAAVALFHDASEIITGDLPTPIKYYNPDIKEAYKQVERIAGNRLLDMLPDYMQSYYQEIFTVSQEDAYLWKLVKAADKLSAYIKCIEEATTGNSEFLSAQQSTRISLEKMELKEVTIFMEEFLSSFGMTLDELTATAAARKNTME